MKRRISHTEITQALDCMARWDFSYGGRLAGDALTAKAPHVRLREGRAWGRGVAAFHQTEPALSLHARYAIALHDLHQSLDEDAEHMREHGVYDQAEHHNMALRLADILWQYAGTAEPLQITDPEFELEVPIPSRSGRGVSNRYVFHGFLDGLAVLDGRLFIAEYKLRDRLTDFEQVVRNRQYRRYAWAAERALGVAIAGVIVDERLNEAPKPPRWVKGKKKSDPPMVPSHAKDQLTTPELYRAVCEEAGVTVDDDTFAALGQRRWQARHTVVFRRSEIEEAGSELVTAARLIAQLDTGALFPIRNPDPRRCNGCPFKEICVRPDDRELVDLNFTRRPPKRDRSLELLEGSIT
jgi:hypothetical protein